MTVRGRLCDGVHADLRIGSRAVLDHHRLTHRFAHPSAYKPREYVGTPSRRIRDDDAYRLRGKRLSRGNAADEEKDQAKE